MGGSWDSLFFCTGRRGSTMAVDEGPRRIVREPLSVEYMVCTVYIRPRLKGVLCYMSAVYALAASVSFITRGVEQTTFVASFQSVRLSLFLVDVSIHLLSVISISDCPLLHECSVLSSITCCATRSLCTGPFLYQIESYAGSYERT